MTTQTSYTVVLERTNVADDPFLKGLPVEFGTQQFAISREQAEQMAADVQAEGGKPQDLLDRYLAMPSVEVPNSVWEDMGRPEQVTVTVVPGAVA